jgi:hypothetical protein
MSRARLSTATSLFLLSSTPHFLQLLNATFHNSTTFKPLLLHCCVSASSALHSPGFFRVSCPQLHSSPPTAASRRVATASACHTALNHRAVFTFFPQSFQHRSWVAFRNHGYPQHQGRPDGRDHRPSGGHCPIRWWHPRLRGQFRGHRTPNPYWQERRLRTRRAVLHMCTRPRPLHPRYKHCEYHL